MLIGAFCFGCFTVLWTSVAFLFSGPPYHYGNAVIGLFGLAGLAGAVAATVAGRLADRGRGAHRDERLDRPAAAELGGARVRQVVGGRAEREGFRRTFPRAEKYPRP